MTKVLVFGHFLILLAFIYQEKRKSNIYNNCIQEGMQQWLVTLILHIKLGSNGFVISYTEGVLSL